MEIQVVKKDGSYQPYDQDKIEKVTVAAGLKPQEGQALALKVTQWIKTQGEEKIETEKIRNFVLEELQKINKFAARAYDWYEKKKDKLSSPF